jgi:hypothetical protein
LTFEQSFRTQGPNAGALDGEYEAFHNGYQSPLPSIDNSQLPHFDHPSVTQAPSKSSSSWASDFQKLQISDPRANVPFIQNHPSLEQHTTRSSNSISGTSQNQYNGGFTNTPISSNFPSGGQEWMGPQVWSGRQNQTYETQSEFNPQLEDAFQREFASFEEAQTKTGAEPAFQQTQAPSKPYQEVRPGSEARKETNMGSQVEGQQPETAQAGYSRDDEPKNDHIKNSNVDNDELSRTAGQLLDSVGDNQSQKFQNSSFIALMRRLRDKEVTVSGDKMVEVQETGSTGTSMEEAVA